MCSSGMNKNIMLQIEKILDENMNDFLTHVADKYLDKKDHKKLFKDWECFRQGTNKMKKTESKPTAKSVEIVFSEEDEENIPTIPTCPHILTVGKNKGKACGIKKVLENGFCSRHKDSNQNKYPPERIVRKHLTLKQWWNPTTKFVFRSKEDTTVIGKTTKIPSAGICPILPLTEEDIETCKNIGYKFDTTKTIAAKEKASKGENEELFIEPDKEPSKIIESPPATPARSHEEITEMVQKILNGDIEEALDEIKIHSDSDDDLPNDEENSDPDLPSDEILSDDE